LLDLRREELGGGSGGVCAREEDVGGVSGSSRGRLAGWSGCHDSGTSTGSSRRMGTLWLFNLAIISLCSRIA
jgi:hypothetical protein